MIISRIVLWFVGVIFAVSWLTSCDIVSDAGDMPPAVLQLADDTASTAANRPVHIDVLRNDVIQDHQELRVTISRQPTAGMVKIDPLIKEYVYTPKQNFSGRDSFEYQVCNRRDVCRQAQVKVIVYRDNVCKLALQDKTINLFRNVSGRYDPVAIDLLANANVCTPLNLIAFKTLEAPQYGKLAYFRDSTAATPYFKCEYIPDNNFQVTKKDRFRYRGFDNRGDTTEATVTIFGN